MSFNILTINILTNLNHHRWRPNPISEVD